MRLVTLGLAVTYFILVFGVGWWISTHLTSESHQLSNTFAALQLVQVWCAFMSGILFAMGVRK
jgi:hypothetical protein